MPDEYGIPWCGDNYGTCLTWEATEIFLSVSYIFYWWSLVIHLTQLQNLLIGIINVEIFTFFNCYLFGVRYIVNTTDGSIVGCQ